MFSLSLHLHGNITLMHLGYYVRQATVTFVTEAIALQSEVQCTHLHGLNFTLLGSDSLLLQ